MSGKERELGNAILREFGTRPELRIARQNTGVAVPYSTVNRAMAALRKGSVAEAAQILGSARPVRFGVPGQADYTGIVPISQNLTCPHCNRGLSAPPLGVRLEIEAKSPKGRQSAEQGAYQEMIERFHGIYVLARCVDDVWCELAARGFQR